MTSPTNPSTTCPCGTVVPDPHGCIAGLTAELACTERDRAIARAELARLRALLREGWQHVETAFFDEIGETDFTALAAWSNAVKAALGGTEGEG